MKNPFVPLMFALVLILAAACGSGEPATTPENARTKAVVEATREGEAMEPTEVPEAIKVPEATEAPAKAALASTPGASVDDTLSLEDRAAGLDKLKSYRLKWVAKSTSTEGDTTKKSSWDWTEEFVADPPGLHWVWTSLDGDNKPTSMETWQIGNTMYMLSGDPSQGGSCVSISSDDRKSQLTKGIFSPSLLGRVNDARYVGRDTVNGIPTRHYRYDEKATLIAGLGKVAGEVWVAEDGGYVAKDQVNWTGGSGLFGAASTGKGDGSWTWELSEVNQPMTIKAPENCEGAAGGLPLMADATDKSTFGDFITYKSKSSPDEVAAFYKEAMPAAGWKLEGEPTATEQMVQMAFAKDDQRAQLIITVADEATQVMITVTK